MRIYLTNKIILYIWISIFFSFSTNIQAEQNLQYHLKWKHGNKLIKEFFVEHHTSQLGFVLTSELKDDIVLNRLSSDADLAANTYLLTMTEGNAVKKRYTTTVTRRENSILLNANILLIELWPVDKVDVGGVTEGWFSPFKELDRTNINLIKQRRIGKFGDYRSSIKKGHKHAGIDLKGDWNEAVYPIANGTVVFKSHFQQTATIVIRHRMRDGRVIYSKYTHIKDSPVKLGELVNPNTKLGRLFNQQELRRSGYKTNHLHLEIRKNYLDKGRASSYSMTMEALDKYCFNPLSFLEEHL